MSIDYEQLKLFVKEAMFTGGGINEPSAPEAIPHRMPASHTADKEQDLGDPKANKLYDMALTAREATEQLVEALDEPVYDGPYEHAFKASASLRRALNSLIDAGAHPVPTQHVVAAPKAQQKYTGGSNAGDYFGGQTGGVTAALGAGGLTEIAEIPDEEHLKQSGAENPQEVAMALRAMHALSEADRERVINALSLMAEEVGGEAENIGGQPSGDEESTTRSKRVGQVTGTGEMQSAESIEKSLSAILTAKGVRPLDLRDALISILTKLQVPSEKALANTIVRKLVKSKRTEKSK